MSNSGEYSLCWECIKSGGGCSWSNGLKPVEGWKAEPDYKMNEYTKKMELYSYKVKECPEFIRGNVKERAVNDDSLERLIKEVGKVIAKEYTVSLHKFLKKPSDDERFFALKSERDIVLHGFLSDTEIATDKFLDDLTRMTIEEMAEEVLINMKQRDFNKLLKEREKKEKH